MTIPAANTKAISTKAISTKADKLGEIAFEDAYKSFGDRAVLRGITFCVPQGTSFALLGRSGTGKSVSLKLVCGLLKPDSGQVLVDGEDVAKLATAPLAKIRRHIGFLFQNSALFDSISVGANVSFPLRRNTDKSESEIHDRAQAILERVGLGKEFETMPSDLSGGMRKRAGLARALAMEPSILLVDEPSAGLDPITSAEIDELLLDIKRSGKVTIVAVTHNIPSAKRIADRLGFLEDGRILAQGTVEELSKNPNELIQKFLSSKESG